MAKHAYNKSSDYRSTDYEPRKLDICVARDTIERKYNQK
jgi:hypothetical protein